MKQSGHSTTAKKATPRRAAQPDLFRFGWRYVQQIGPNGRKRSVQVPLTPDDVLHPREGDHISENSQQEMDRTYLTIVLRYRLADNPHALVLSDCLINWGVRRLRNHSPDISVFEEVRDVNRHWGTFVLAAEGARPVMAIEIVSPDAHDRRARDNDVVIKVREYYRAGVPLYVLVDQERVDGPRQLVGYRRDARKYVRLPLDGQGRLLLEPVGLLVGLRDDKVVCWDADTAEEIQDFTAQAQARQAAETALAAALARIQELEARAR